MNGFAVELHVRMSVAYCWDRPLWSEVFWLGFAQVVHGIVSAAF
jgi:hypothetical protein